MQPAAFVGGARWSGPLTAGAESLATPTAELLRHVREAERALGAQEWWLLGREIPEALALSEIVSLLAVARGELEQVVSGSFGQLPTGASEDEPATEDVVTSLMSDPGWLAARRDEAAALIITARSALPGLAQYAQALQAHAERAGMPPNTLSALGIVADRLSEVTEAISQSRG
jgi:hypothetical protein